MSLLAETAVSESNAQCHVRVLTDRCAGCQECVVRCPTGALSMDVDRWIASAEDALCVGCRQCERTCPFTAIEVSGPVLVEARTDVHHRQPGTFLGDTSESHRGFTGWAEALTEADRCLECPDPTCVRGCPAHNDIPAFIAALRDRDLLGAHAVLRRTTVMPDVCSRVCNQSAQCEGACTWSLAGDAPVAIGRLERFVADNLAVPAPRRSSADGEGRSVAVIGSGPAAIAAAWQLIEAGAAVTVYERESEPGGVLGWGIPDFTLPRAVAERPWHQLRSAGVELRCNSAITPEDVGCLRAAHDAVLVAVGATQGLKLSVPGTDLEGVVDATSFLTAAKRALGDGGDPVDFMTGFGLASKPSGTGAGRPRILVLGAGNTAMDVARMGLRLGCDATCIDWLDERYALARPDELEEARGEGVEVRFSRTLVGIEGRDGRAAVAALATTTQARRNKPPKMSRKPRENLPVDLVVMAMGYRVDPDFTRIGSGLPIRRAATGIPDRGWVASGVLANRASSFAFNYPVGELALARETGLAAAAHPVAERTWVLGDALVGPSTVVEAMAQGRRAADAVLAELGTYNGMAR